MPTTPRPTTPASTKVVPGDATPPEPATASASTAAATRRTDQHQTRQTDAPITWPTTADALNTAPRSIGDGSSDSQQTSTGAPEVSATGGSEIAPPDSPDASTDTDRAGTETDTAGGATTAKDAASDSSDDVRPVRAGSALQDRVWGALRAHPGATAAELSAESRVSRSAVAKILVVWAADGSASSTAGPTPRAARLWTAAPSLPIPAAMHTADQTPSPIADDSTDAIKYDQPDNSGNSAALLPNPDITGSAKKGPRRRATKNRSGSERLGAGALRGQVEEFLTGHAGDHSPVQIGKAIRRSSGAVANALERLVDTGWAVRTSDKPKRYQAATDTDPAQIASTATDQPGG